MDTIKIAAEKQVIEIDADFNVYTDSSAFGGLLEERVLWPPGETHLR